MGIQLDFFTDEKSDIEYLKDDFEVLKDSNDRVRKSLFAKHADLAKRYIELHNRLEIIERNICRGEIK